MPGRDGPPPPSGRPDFDTPPPENAARTARNRMLGDRPPITEEGLRGFRDVVAEAENLGEKTAQASRSARQAYAAVPTNMPEFDRVEPRIEPSPLSRQTESRTAEPRPSTREASREAPREALRETPRDAPREAPNEGRAPPPPPPAPPPSSLRRPPNGPSPRQPEARPPSPVAVHPADEHDSFEPGRSRKGLVAVFLTLFVILGVGLLAYLMRDRIATLTGAMRSLAPQAQKDTAPARPKIPDRVGQDAQPGAARPAPQPAAPPAQQAVPAVAQRVVLYEEDPAEPAGKRYVGSAIWRTETVSPGSGQAPELAVRCDVEIPERRLAMTLSLRRNTDQALPASHTVEIMFNLPADFPFGGISNVPGILMKQAEQTRGAPLSGLAVKVTSGFFLLGLSSVDSEKERNIQLLKERSWFDIPVVYNNGRRAIVAVEKGNPGERAFADAFAAWGQ